MKLRILLLGVLIGVSPMCFQPDVKAGIPDGSDLKGRILRTEGQVLVKSPGEAEWKTPQSGGWLAQGSEIKTASDSKCEIGLGENRKSLLSMKEDSVARLSEMSAGKIAVELKSGRVFALVRDLKPESQFVVATPTAVASARGTGWEQDMDTVQVFEHSVEVAGSDGEKMSVEEGFGVDIENGDIQEPFTISEEAKSEWSGFERDAEKLIIEESSLPAETGNEVPPADTATADPKTPEPKMEDLNSVDSKDDAPESDSAFNEPVIDTTSGGKEEGFDSANNFDPDNSFDSFDNSFGDSTGGLAGFENTANEPMGGKSGTDAVHDIKDEQHDTTQPPPDSTKPPCSSGSTANC